MARRRATLTMTPVALAEALQVSLALTPRGDGQVAAQREILAAVQNALMRAGSASLSANRR